MATQAQLANADKFFGGVRNSVVQLKIIKTQAASLVAFYNGLNTAQKDALLALKNLDRTEADAIIATLTSIGTSIDTLPSVDPSF